MSTTTTATRRRRTEPTQQALSDAPDPVAAGQAFAAAMTAPYPTKATRKKAAPIDDPSVVSATAPGEKPKRRRMMTTKEFVGGLADAAAPEPVVAPTPAPTPEPEPDPPLRQVITWTDDRPIIERTNGAMSLGATLKVTDARTYGIAAEIIVAGKDLIKEIRAFFEDDRKMADALHKSITKKINDAVGRVQPTIDRLSRECQDWRNEQERIRLAEQARIAADEKKRQDAIAQAAAEELRAGGLEDAAEAVLEEARMAASALPMTTSVASTVPDSPLTYRDNWEWTVVDESKIPREYYIRDDKAISAVVRAQKGLCRIPGIQVKNNPIPVSSGRRG